MRNVELSVGPPTPVASKHRAPRRRAKFQSSGSRIARFEAAGAADHGGPRRAGQETR
jgi:hypothetical protein